MLIFHICVVCSCYHTVPNPVREIFFEFFIFPSYSIKIWDARKIFAETKYGKGRSSRPEMLCKNGVLRNIAKFTGKHLCESLFFNKFAGVRPATLLKKKIWHWYFPVNFAKFLRTSFLTKHLRWLLLEGFS